MGYLAICALAASILLSISQGDSRTAETSIIHVTPTDPAANTTSWLQVAGSQERKAAIRKQAKGGNGGSAGQPGEPGGNDELADKTAGVDAGDNGGKGGKVGRAGNGGKGGNSRHVEQVEHEHCEHGEDNERGVHTGHDEHGKRYKHDDCERGKNVAHGGPGGPSAHDGHGAQDAQGGPGGHDVHDGRGGHGAHGGRGGKSGHGARHGQGGHGGNGRPDGSSPQNDEVVGNGAANNSKDRSNDKAGRNGAAGRSDATGHPTHARINPKAGRQPDGNAEAHDNNNKRNQRYPLRPTHKQSPSRRAISTTVSPAAADQNTNADASPEEALTVHERQSYKIHTTNSSVAATWRLFNP